jgi:PAS domain S-box-containing protein
MARDAAPFLTDLAPKLPLALERLAFPSYVIDADGRIRWLNESARKILGDVEGRYFVSVLDPSEAARARTQFVRNLGGEEHGEFSVLVVGIDGATHQLEVSSAPLMSGHRAIGMFGVGRLHDAGRRAVAAVDDRLTPRQHEVLQRLAHGLSTDQISADLHITRETTRNHIRHLLRRLGARSRLEAVAIAHRDDLV